MCGSGILDTSGLSWCAVFPISIIRDFFVLVHAEREAWYTTSIDESLLVGIMLHPMGVFSFLILLNPSVIWDCVDVAAMLVLVAQIFS